MLGVRVNAALRARLLDRTLESVEPTLLTSSHSYLIDGEQCIDRQPARASTNLDANCPKHLDTVHYVIVRADLPHGAQIAQAIHAAGESTPSRLKPGTIAVALHARDEAHLKSVADSLDGASIANHRVLECDGELMAIGIEPTTDRAAVKKVLSQLPLAR
jgi:hypothetical protein